MNYIGSKNKLSGFIKSSIKEVVGEDLSKCVFCDLFAGTGIIGRTFKQDVRKVIANDIEYYSYILNKNYVGNHKLLPEKEERLACLRETEPYEGFIYTNYCKEGNGERQYFSDTNGKKIDGIRLQIQKWQTAGEINDELHAFLLASLLESADKVANTASVYAAYLKHLKKSAQKELDLIPAEFDINHNDHEVYNEDANKLLPQISGDILYLDPPYNERQYGANYHLLNTIAHYDQFIPRGKTGLREYGKSKYCSRQQVTGEFMDLLRNADFKYIFLSYNNEGLMSCDTIQKVMSMFGKYDLVQTDYQRFRADREENRNHLADKTCEYLHILEK